MNNSARGLQELTHLYMGLFVSSTLDSAQPNSPPPTTIVNRPWVTPPEGFVPFDGAAAIALPAVGLAQVLAITVPDGHDGVINQFSWNFTGGGFVQGSGDIIVQVQRDGVAVRNFENILVEKGTIGVARPISPIRVYNKQVISIVVNHAANALLNGFIVGSLVGYFYPTQN